MGKYDKRDNRVSEIEHKIETLLSQARNMHPEERDKMLVRVREYCTRYREITGRYYKADNQQ